MGWHRIRGPKVYPHHRHASLAIQSTAYAGERSNQNRSTTGWVKPEVEFEFPLHVTDLSACELGALIWLLSLDENHFLRLGLGKPLGFGSVRAEIVSEGTRIATGEDWAACIFPELTSNPSLSRNPSQ